MSSNSRSTSAIGFLLILCGVIGAITLPGVARAQPAVDDRLLSKVVEAYQVRPLELKSVSLGAKERLGQALFFDPIMSGPRMISCATCHVRSKAAGDGLSVSVGLGAKGIGDERQASKDAFLIPRNALPFFNRGRVEFRSLFWDGRVQRGPQGQIESPLGKNLPKGFESILAAATVFPLGEPDEMLGRYEERRNGGKYHQELVDDTDLHVNNFQQRTLSVFDRLVTRVVGGPGAASNGAQTRYRQLFSDAFSGLAPDAIRISHFGNALAAYIQAAFELQRSPWDKYVAGDTKAISNEQKRGALLFYGKGRCAVCHSGIEFSDFGFHGLAVPQLSVGKHGAFLDYGRAAATSRGIDRFKFRTPPLRNVVESGPWGHNGIFATLDQVLKHHFNPVPALFLAQQAQPESARYAGKLLSQRSPILGEISPFTESELQEVISFLGSSSISLGFFPCCGTIQ